MPRPAALALLCLAVAGPALAGPKLEFRGQPPMLETLRSSASGEMLRTLRPAGTVKPGDILVYAIHYRNVGDAASDDVSINVSIPDEVEYVAGWVEGSDVKPEVSIDRGIHYAPLEKLTETNADGSQRSLLPQDVTNLRWDLPLVVQPGQEGQVVYRARVRQPRQYDISKPSFRQALAATSTTGR